MKSGTIEVTDEESTWEKIISTEGSNTESWNKVVDTCFSKEI